MHASLSGRRVFNALCGIWPDFKKFLSFDRLLSNGWVNNVFFDKDFSHVWRGNGRIDETIFWDVFCNVFAGLEGSSASSPRGTTGIRGWLFSKSGSGTGPSTTRAGRRPCRAGIFRPRSSRPSSCEKWSGSFPRRR